MIMERTRPEVAGQGEDDAPGTVRIALLLLTGGTFVWYNQFTEQLSEESKKLTKWMNENKKYYLNN
jgi:hypothetical protein